MLIRRLLMHYYILDCTRFEGFLFQEFNKSCAFLNFVKVLINA